MLQKQITIHDIVDIIFERFSNTSVPLLMKKIRKEHSFPYNSFISKIIYFYIL